MQTSKLSIHAIVAILMVSIGTMAAAEETPEPLAEILGVTVGMAETEAREILTPLGETAGRDTRSGGRKQGFILENSDYAWVAYKAGHSGKLKWVSANLRPGKEIPFSELGELGAADSANEFLAIWNVARGDSSYRLVAKGQNGMASIVYLLALD